MHSIFVLLTNVVTVAALAVGVLSSPVAQPSAAFGQSVLPFEGFAELPGVHLWYTDTGGSGVPIVFLHAGSGNADMWQFNAPAFADAGYRAIAYDRRGFGRSTANPETGPQPGGAADDLEALADYLGIDRFHLVAMAAGGSVAYDFALWRPERLRSLTVGNSGGGGLQDREVAEMRTRATFPDFREWPVHYRELSLGYMATNPEGLARWMEVTTRSRQEGSPDQEPHNVLTVPALETISVPTLILSAEADVSNPPWVIRRQAESIPGAQFALISESGHSINWEQPEVFDRTVMDFIAGH